MSYRYWHSIVFEGRVDSEFSFFLKSIEELENWVGIEEDDEVNVARYKANVIDRQTTKKKYFTKGKWMKLFSGDV